MALSRECLMEIIAADGDVQSVLDALVPEFRAVNGDEYLENFLAAASNDWPVSDIVKLADVIHDGLARTPRKNGLPLYISPRVRAEVIARDGYVCTYCGGDVTIPHLDHVVPRSKGGPSTTDNLVVSCQSCNASKRDRPLSEWSARR